MAPEHRKQVLLAILAMLLAVLASGVSESAEVGFDFEAGCCHYSPP